ncbi:FtsX-like permease family protein [Lacticaseibacillus daqingensis]|uniref:FtsX-like permease family protein n=1 Tax=Lacticaseibacillus daqingensis TaxID=2486014 RepID=UPI000F78E5C1|nr:ABC transporter permease [Lacticaseibacillus daqingensis]
MFLALKEIKKEKLRSGLIVAMIVLIGYLIFILTSLALGLARQNTDAINSWGITRITLNDNANVDMRQSFLTKAQVGTLTAKDALIGETATVVKSAKHKQVSAVFMGLRQQDFIARKLGLESGRRVAGKRELVADTALKLAGYKLGSKVTLNDHTFTIVGFTNNAKINVAPIVYGELSTWQTLRGIDFGPIASAVVSKPGSTRKATAGTKTYAKQTLIDKLPGYTAQTTTFVMMIAFLMVISLIIIAVFLYILTMQKLPNYAVLRVQGIPSRVLVEATVAQSVLLVLSGLVGATALTALTAVMIPASVPMAFDVPLLAAVGLGLLVMALIGGLIPIRSVLKVDPVSVIGG